VEPTPSAIRSQTFEQVRRGWDPKAVSSFLEVLAAQLERQQREIDGLQRELDAARETAYLAERRLRSASRKTQRVRAEAEDEARERLVNARREALELMARTRHDADVMMNEAREEETALRHRIEVLRAVVSRTENLMKGLASGALGELAHAHLMLEDAPEEAASIEVIVDDGRTPIGAAAPTPLPAAVDRLLTRLREIG
jgi:cell division septum initiation protein DivIVA